MLFLKYPRPVTRENLPEVAAAFYRFKRKIRRRRIISFFCSLLCFVLHTALMILASVGLYHRVAGPKYAAVLDSLPYVKEVLDFCFHTLPERFGLSFQLPELLGFPVAVLLPPLLCMLLAMLLRLLFAFRGKSKAPGALDPGRLLEEAQDLSDRCSRSRKANWTMLSGALSLIAFAGAVVYSLYIVRPASDEWDVKFLFSYVFIGIVAFSGFQLIASLTDTILELLCGLDVQWDGIRFVGDLMNCALGKNEGQKPAPAEKPEPGAQGEESAEEPRP